LLKGNYFFTFYNQFIEVNLFCSLVVSILHSVEVKEFTSGLQNPLREREEFCLILEGVFLRG
jgi:hypothetical protein